MRSWWVDNESRKPVPPQGEEPDNAEERYASGLDKFTKAVERAVASSHQAAGIDAGPRRYWGSVLFTRLCSSSVSILWLCPGSRVNLRGDHWDFSAVACLTRSLLECGLYFSYIAIEPISDEEWKARLKVMQLHDCKERERMFRALDSSDAHLQGFEEQANELRAILQANPFFVSLSEPLRKSLLKGERSSILTQDEIYNRIGGLPANFRGLYRFYSSHAHSFRWLSIAPANVIGAAVRKMKLRRDISQALWISPRRC
jgi:hypothetical protein